MPLIDLTLEELLKNDPRALRPNAQAFDEIRIITGPQFESSEGGEYAIWKIKAKIAFMRKGKVIHEEETYNIQRAVNILPYLFLKAIDDGHALFGGSWDGYFCDQEGCSNSIDVVYKIKRKYCDVCGMDSDNNASENNSYRCFCKEHAKRGFFYLYNGSEDSDDNYELVWESKKILEESRGEK